MVMVQLSASISNTQMSSLADLKPPPPKEGIVSLLRGIPSHSKQRPMRSLAPPKSLPSSLYLPFSGVPLLERIVNHLIKEPAAGMVYKEAYATINQLWL